MGRHCGSGSINFLVVGVKSEVLMPGWEVVGRRVHQDKARVAFLWCSSLWLWFLPLLCASVEGEE